MNHTECQCKCKKTEDDCRKHGKVNLYKNEKSMKYIFLLSIRNLILHYASVQNQLVFLNVKQINIVNFIIHKKNQSVSVNDLFQVEMVHIHVRKVINLMHVAS